MANVFINTNVLSWAIERANLSVGALKKDFPKIEQWLSGELQPTIKQVQKLAQKTRTTFGYFFLSDIPEVSLSVPMFRTVGDRPLYTPSPELLDTLYAMERRQDWMREYLVGESEDPLPLIGSVSLNDDIKGVVSKIKETLGLNDNWTTESVDLFESEFNLREAINDVGIIIVKNGVVGNNTHRPLNSKEFRGFVLVDEYAPLIFVNNKDFEGAKLFTMAHELAHIWLGKSAIFNLDSLMPFDNDIENFCNKVAAEFLVPEKKFRELWTQSLDVGEQSKTLSRKFKVSPIVIARRARDLDYINKEVYYNFYNNYKEELKLTEEERERKRIERGKKKGGDYYNNQNVRLGKRFAEAVFIAVKERKLSYSEAFSLTDLYGSSFKNYSQKLGYEL